MLKPLFAALLLAAAIAVAPDSAEKPESAAKPLDSDAVLRKAAETYKSMKTYYEVSDYTRSLDVQGQKVEKKLQVTTAFRRPDTLVIRITGDENVVMRFAGGKMVMLSPKENEYTTQEGITLNQIAESLEFPLPAVVISDDAYTFLKEDASRIGELKTDRLAEREVYRIDATNEQGVEVANFFDKERFNLVGIKAVATAPEEQGGGRMELSMVASMTLIDEAPKGADGKAMDVFAFEIPAGAKEFKPEAEGVETEKLVGQQAPDWSLKNLAGETVTLSGLKGKVVLLDFWATWCPPCRQEMPDLVALADEYKGKPFAFYAVDYSEDAATIQRFIEETSLGVPALLAAGTKVADDYRIVGIPTTFVIDKGGRVSAAYVGVQPRERVKASIDKALAAGG